MRAECPVRVTVFAHEQTFYRDRQRRSLTLAVPRLWQRNGTRRLIVLSDGDTGRSTDLQE